MKCISLTQGQFAVVDDEDYEELSKHKWHACWRPHTQSFYAQRNIRLPNDKQATELMHRRILGLERGDKRQGDHIDHRTLDNRRSNVRIVTSQENHHNQRCNGYYWSNRDKKYRAQIVANDVAKYLGSFDTKEEARKAYLSAKRVLHPSAPIPKEKGA